MNSFELIGEESFVFDRAPVRAIKTGKELARANFNHSNSNALVSCLMLSKGNLNVLHHSLSCFLHQTYEHCELWADDLFQETSDHGNLVSVGF
jgi:hypothetical protein